MGSIPVLYSFARSGGTLVNQLLGVHPQCLVLSEINPAASYKPVVEQAVNWLGLVTNDEAENFSLLPYYEQVQSLHDRAVKQGKCLIVRDWVTVNFLFGCAGEHIMPSGQLEQELYLERAGIASVPLVITRRSIDIYRSIKNNFLHLQNIDLGSFAESYLEYAHAVTKYPVIHLENLRSDPENTLLDILSCFHLESKIYQSLIQEFYAFKNCTGNNTLPILNESATSHKILPPEKSVCTERAFVEDPVALCEADKLFGYE